MKNMKLENKDAFELLKETKDDSIDLVIIDPPYDISQTGKKRFHGTSMDFGSWDHGTTDMKKICEEVYRVLKKGGTFVCFYDLWKMETLKKYCEEAKFTKINMIEWQKTNPLPVNSNITYLTNSRELAIYAVKPGDKAVFNSKYDNGIYKCSVCQGKYRFHPTQKPVQLIEEIILKHSNEGDTVLDCFSGSGTTAVASLKNGRKFIGCELDEEYYKKSYERIEAELGYCA